MQILDSRGTVFNVEEDDPRAVEARRDSAVRRFVARFDDEDMDVFQRESIRDLLRFLKWREIK